MLAAQVAALCLCAFVGGHLFAVAIDCYRGR